MLYSSMSVALSKFHTVRDTTPMSEKSPPKPLLANTKEPPDDAPLPLTTFTTTTDRL
jgi:hypothetical protein